MVSNNFISFEKKKQIEKMSKEGFSERKIANAVGVAKATVGRYSTGENCGCGRPKSHHGYCKFRREANGRS